MFTADNEMAIKMMVMIIRLMTLMDNDYNIIEEIIIILIISKNSIEMTL